MKNSLKRLWFFLTFWHLPMDGGGIVGIKLAWEVSRILYEK